MRLSTRIALGFFMVAGLLIGALAYQLTVVERLQRINQEISLTNLEAARISVWLLEGLEGIREFALKSSILGDPAYGEQWEEWEEVMEGDLRTLDGIGLAGPEEEARQGIQAAWEEYQSVADRVRGDPGSLFEVELALATLRTRIEELIVANEASVSDHAQSSILAGNEARRVAWLAAAGALILAGFAGFLLHLSIAGPLVSLTRGTKELARGRFDHRLDVHGPGELAGLAEDFNQMAARLDELEELKRDFVSHVSHELKTPLAAIQETIEIFVEQIPGPLNAKQMRLMGLSRSSAQRLSSMISDLLDASRLEAGATTYYPETNDLAAIAREVLEEVGPLAREGALDLTLKVDVRGSASAPAVCDGARMRDVIMNVVTNGLRFSPREGLLELSISEVTALPAEIPPHLEDPLCSEAAPFILLSVADEGPGVADEEKERIFEKFHQSQRRERLNGQGVGLGLAIARRLVQAHGGAIWVEDGPTGGACFRILVPRTPRRWKEHTLEEEGIPAASGSSMARAAVERITFRVSSIVILAGLLSACATLRGGEEPTPGPEPVVAAPVPVVQPKPPPLPGVLSSAGKLVEAREHLVAERFPEALDGFQSLLGDGMGNPETVAEALWGLALLNLHPRNAEGSTGAAIAYLDTLMEEFPSTWAGVQAEWALGLMSDLSEHAARIQEQDALLQELNAVLDALRGIDLQRQPSRAPVRSDGSP